MANNKFAFLLPSKKNDPKGSFKKAILNQLSNNYPHLTIDGIDYPDTGLGIRYAGPKDCITFGSSNYHDVSWTNEDIKNVMDEMPVYTPENWFAFTKKLEKFANGEEDEYLKKKGYDFTLNGEPVKVYDNFIQVGYRIIPRNTYNYKPTTTIETTIISLMIKFS